MTSSMQPSTLLASGRIYLIRQPVSGRTGIVKLWNMLCAGTLGVKFDVESPEEIWVLMVNRRRNRLRILHVDTWGYELTTRINFDGRFDVIFNEGGPQNITRGELRRLVLDGTVEGSWRSESLKNLWPSMGLD